MTDILERMYKWGDRRNLYGLKSDDGKYALVEIAALDDAKDEIERLWSENKAMIEILKDAVEDPNEFEIDWYLEAKKIIAALDNGQPEQQDKKREAADHIGDD